MSFFENHFIWRKIAVTIVVGHLILICLTSFGVWDNIAFVYWQRISSWLLHLRSLTFFIFPVALWFSAERKQHLWAIVLMIIGSVALLGYINLITILSANFARHVGTVRYDSKIHHLTSVERFDTETKYYLGECDKLGFVCRFRLVYNKNVFADPKLIPILAISEDRQELILIFDEEIVYSFDRNNEICEISEHGFCPYRLIEEK